MFLQEIASIMKFVLDNSDGVSPYYNSVPENFVVPSVYFNVPIAKTRGDTTSGYSIDYDFDILFFHKTVNEAYDITLNVLTIINSNKCKIPLIDWEGKPTGKYVRISETSISKSDEIKVSLKLTFSMLKPYTTKQYEKMKTYTIEDFYKEKIIEEEIKTWLNQ